MILEIGHEMLWGEKPSDACQGKYREDQGALEQVPRVRLPELRDLYHRVVWEWVVRCARHRAVAHVGSGRSSTMQFQ